MKVATVTIDRGGVAVRINEDRFDPETDKLWKGDLPKPGKPKASTPTVEHTGGGWYVVKVDGETVSGPDKLRKEAAEEFADSYGED